MDALLPVDLGGDGGEWSLVRIACVDPTIPLPEPLGEALSSISSVSVSLSFAVDIAFIGMGGREELAGVLGSEDAVLSLLLLYELWSLQGLDEK